jgi:hypothetical protein
MTTSSAAEGGRLNEVPDLLAERIRHETRPDRLGTDVGAPGSLP